jgi:hypothetical protein
MSTATIFLYPSFSIADITIWQASMMGTCYTPFKLKFRMLCNIRTLKEGCGFVFVINFAGHVHNFCKVKGVSLLKWQFKTKRTSI